jgi:hypothetical protein
MKEYVVIFRDGSTFEIEAEEMTESSGWLIFWVGEDGEVGRVATAYVSGVRARAPVTA